MPTEIEGEAAYAKGFADREMARRWAADERP
jgi:hypothetical protein